MKVLIKGEFWFNLPKNQNDPFEGEFIAKDYYSLPKNSLIDFYYRQHPELLNGSSLQQKLDEISVDSKIFHNDMYVVLKKRLKEHYGITCFSYIKDSILMWSYYADSHKGFCIIYDKDVLTETIRYPNFAIGYKDVIYTSTLCEAELIIKDGSIGFKNEKEVLFRKLNIWRKEKETRLIAFF